MTSRRSPGPALAMLSLFVFAAVAGLGCWRQGEFGHAVPSAAGHLDAEGYNLVIVSLTNVRSDHVGLLGYPRDTTPHLDAFFASGMIFDRTIAPAPWTLPVAASLFTATFPFTHRVMDHNTALDDRFLTLAEALRQRGYATAALTGGGHYHRRYNLRQGFELYLDEENYADFGLSPRIEPGAAKPLRFLGVEALMPAAMQWLDQAQEPFFLFLQGFDAHCPFSPSDRFADRFGDPYDGDVDFRSCLWNLGPGDPVERGGERQWPVRMWDGEEYREVLLRNGDVARMVALYDGEIAQADAALAPLLDRLERSGLTERSLVVFLSEHGDLFGEHGRFMRSGPHRGTFYQPVLSFPLAIRHPGVTERRRDSALVQTVDLLPTLLHLLAIPDPALAGRQGASLVPWLLGEGPEPNERVYAGSLYSPFQNPFFTGSSLAAAVRDREWKLIYEATCVAAEMLDAGNAEGRMPERNLELFHLAADPSETRDLYAREPARARALWDALFAKFGLDLVLRCAVP